MIVNNLLLCLLLTFSRTIERTPALASQVKRQGDMVEHALQPRVTVPVNFFQLIFYRAQYRFRTLESSFPNSFGV